MTSSRITGDIDFKNVKVKSEPFDIRMEEIIADKCAYNIVFKNVQPTNNEKLEILNSLIIKTEAVDELKQYYKDRAYIFYQMRQWTNVLNDINNIENLGNLDGDLSILKIKSNMRNEMEKSRQIIFKTTSLGVIENVDEHYNLLNIINQCDQLIEKKTYQTKRLSIKNNLKRLQK